MESRKRKRFIKRILFGIIATSIIMSSTLADEELNIVKRERHQVQPGDSVSILRGARLALMTCAHCHRGEDNKLSGQLFNKSEPQFGKVYAPNITQSKTFGIGNWSEEELIQLLRTGAKPNGKKALPFMPRFPLMSDQDINDLLNFLQSDHFLVMASEHEVPEHKLSILSKLGQWFFAKTLPPPSQSIPSPDTTQAVLHGKYLVDGVLHCFSCHSGSLPRINLQHPEKTPDYLMGGSHFKNLDGERVEAPNITFQGEDGITHYSLNDFKMLMRFGQKADGTYVQYPMQPYTSLTDREIKAIFAYLKAYKP